MLFILESRRPVTGRLVRHRVFGRTANISSYPKAPLILSLNSLVFDALSYPD